MSIHGGRVYEGIYTTLQGSGVLDLWEDQFTQLIATVKRSYLFLGTNTITPSVAPGGGVPGQFTFTTAVPLLGTSFTIWIPQRVPDAAAKSQFSEFVFNASAANARAGLILCGIGDGRFVDTTIGVGQNQAYTIEFVSSAAQVLLRSLINGAQLTIGAAYAFPAAGTKVTATVTFGVGQNVIELFYDNVSQGTRTDVGPTVGQVGTPGFYARDPTVAGLTFTFSSFRCGVIGKKGF